MHPCLISAPHYHYIATFPSADEWTKRQFVDCIHTSAQWKIQRQRRRNNKSLFVALGERCFFVLQARAYPSFSDSCLHHETVGLDGDDGGQKWTKELDAEFFSPQKIGPFKKERWLSFPLSLFPFFPKGEKSSSELQQSEVSNDGIKRII